MERLRDRGGDMWRWRRCEGVKPVNLVCKLTGPGDVLLVSFLHIWIQELIWRKEVKKKREFWKF